MATASGNKAGAFNGTYPQYATPYIFWSYDQSIPNNNTVLTATLKVKREKTGSTTNKTSTPWSITIGGTKTSGTISFKITNVSAGEYITIGSASKTISHNSDGYCSAVSISATIDISGTTLGTGSVSTSVTPTTIPRASTPTLSASSVAMGSSITIYTNRKSDSFTHTFTYKFGNASGTIATGIKNDTTWTPPLSLANQIPNNYEGTGTITCQTYNGSTLVGSKSINIKLTVPSSVVPSISSIALSAGNSNVPSSWGVYVQGKSALKVVTTASGSYSSTIKSYKITGIDNNTYYSSNFTSSILQSSGTKTITVTVTDSRGRTATKTTTYTCVAYSNPSITTATVTRCNSDGTANEEGTYVKYTFKASVSSVSSKNTYSYKLGYKNSTSSSYTYITISNSAYTLDKSNVVISGVTFSVDNSYDFQFLVTDYFTSTSVVKSIGTGFTLMDFNASGKGMAIGKVSEKDAFEVGMMMFDRLGDLEVLSPLHYGLGTRCKLVGGDWNTACGTESGFYMGCNLANSPEVPIEGHNWFYMIHMVHDEYYQFQIGRCFHSYKIWQRSMSGGNWGAWECINNNSCVTYQNWDTGQTITVDSVITGMNVDITTYGRPILVNFTLPITHTGGTCWIDLVVDGQILERYGHSVQSFTYVHHSKVFPIGVGTHNVHIRICPNNVSEVYINSYNSKSFSVCEL